MCISNSAAHRAKLARMITAVAPRLSGLGLALVFAGGLSGCDPKPNGSGAAGTTTTAASATAAPTPPSAEPAPPPPPDLDVAALQKTLACAANAKSGPCAVLAAFATCKSWSAEVPSGDGRWLGRGYEVDGKTTTDQVALLRLRRVPSSEVGPGQLPARLALGVVAKEEGAPFTEADKAIRALERSDVPPRGNAAIEHLKAKTQWSTASRTAGSTCARGRNASSTSCGGPPRAPAPGTASTRPCGVRHGDVPR